VCVQEDLRRQNEFRDDDGEHKIISNVDQQTPCTRNSGDTRIQICQSRGNFNVRLVKNGRVSDDIRTRTVPGTGIALFAKTVDSHVANRVMCR